MFYNYISVKKTSCSDYQNVTIPQTEALFFLLNIYPHSTFHRFIIYTNNITFKKTHYNTKDVYKF